MSRFGLPFLLISWTPSASWMGATSMDNKKSSWDIVECPDCKSKQLTIVEVDKHLITFECRECEKQFQRNMSKKQGADIDG